MTATVHRHTAGRVREIAKERARDAKAQFAADTILYMHAESTPPHPDTIDALDNDGWQHLESVVSATRKRTTTFTSPEAREAVRRTYRARWEYRRQFAAMTTKELLDV